MRAYPHQICMKALRGEQTAFGRGLPTKAEAAAWLKQMYGQDFGEDAQLWGAWLRHNWQKGLEHGRRRTPPARE